MTSTPNRAGGMRRRTALAALAIPALPAYAQPRSPLAPTNFKVIATDFGGGIQFIDGNVRCSINSLGRVAFVASPTPPPPQPTKAIYFGSGGALSQIPTQTRGYTEVTAVQLAARGGVAFAGVRTSAGSSWRGIYRATASTVSTLYEGALPYVFGNPPPAQNRLAMSTNSGSLAFSSLVDGQGGIYRSTFAGPPTLLRQGTGAFYNNLALAVSANGDVGVQMEYSDPYGPLQRGLLVFDAPGDTLATIESTVERQNVGVQPELAMNGLGQMAFVLGSPVTIQYYSDPLGGGVPTTSLAIPAGVHVATPTAFGTGFAFTTVAAPSDGFTNFGKVAINDAGQVVFEASAGSGTFGIFAGNDPVADKIVVTGEDVVLGGENHFFSIVRLGGLNNQGQLAFQTSDFRTTDQQIWRVRIA